MGPFTDTVWIVQISSMKQLDDPLMPIFCGPGERILTILRVLGLHIYVSSLNKCLDTSCKP